jgi:hypothetical protein
MTGVEATLASGLLNIAGNKLGSLISSEFAAITGAKKDLSDLQDIRSNLCRCYETLRHKMPLFPVP